MPGTPYITPGMLTSAPAGIAWQVIPTLTADSAAQLAQLDQVCWRATSLVDTYCHQPLRATVTTQTDTGPGLSRIAVDRHTDTGTIITRYSPVAEVLAVQLSPTRAFPPQWTAVPAGQYRPRHPVVTSPNPTPVTTPSGGNLIDVAPGHITGRHGRGGWNVQCTYISGWAHTNLTAPATAGAVQVSVDDVTGWAAATGFCYDGPDTEVITATTATATQPAQLPNGAGTVQAGPGTLTLASPLTHDHPAGTVFSALPTAVIQASILLATVQALEGIDAIATQSMTGQLAGGTGALATEAEMILDYYRRVM